MVHVLTIFFMILIVWTIYSIALVIDDDALNIYSEDDIPMKIAKIYWWIIIGGIILFLLWFVSFEISKGIICLSSNNDNRICEKEIK